VDYTLRLYRRNNARKWEEPERIHVSRGARNRFSHAPIRNEQGFDYSHPLAEKLLPAGVMGIGTETILVRRPCPHRFTDESSAGFPFSRHGQMHWHRHWTCICSPMRVVSGQEARTFSPPSRLRAE